jgi:hypothetical protein
MTQRKSLPLFFCVASVLLFTQSLFAAGNYPMPTICDRTCWSARAPQCAISQESNLTRAVIHHTAGTADYDVSNLEEAKARVRAIQNLHMDTNGWCDIGYHFLADKLGDGFEGRQGSISSYPRGAHDGVNTQSFGFNVMGYMHSPYNQQPTTAQRAMLYDLIAWKVPDPFTGFGSGSYGGKTVGFICGHRDVVSTACPGDLMYQYIGTDVNSGEARIEVNNRITGGGGGGSTEIIVDNDSGSPAYTETGGWSTSGAAGYNGGTYRYAKAGDPNTATWTAVLPEAGDYDVFVIYVAGTNRSNSVKYDVATAGGTQTAYVNQQLSSLTWVKLGNYSFNAGNATLTLDGAASAQVSGTDVVIADAVKFVAAAPTPQPPAAPSNLVATTISKSQINLAWQDNSSDEVNFVLERKKGTGSYSVIATLGADTTSYSDTGLVKNTTYTYRIKAVNAAGSSAYSNEATAKTLTR